MRAEKSAIARPLIGSVGAVLGALLPSLALFLAIPSLACWWDQCSSVSGSITGPEVRELGERIFSLSFAWEPYIDNAEHWSLDDRTKRCRPEEAPLPPSLRLTRFAFPRSFTPMSFPDRALFACILARGDGTILDVRLAQPIHGPAADRELIETIRKAWHFDGPGGGIAGWERVRLNAGTWINEPQGLIL